MQASENAILPREPVSAPSYDTILCWMESLPSERSIAFDWWARGNFTRRLLWNHGAGLRPLLVAASSLGEMEWAFRRLLLLGQPVDFLYTGPLQEAKVLALCPRDILFDAGWGYTVAPVEETTRLRGREFFPMLGYGKFLPAWALDWLTAHGAEAFRSGNLFIAPAELVGINADTLDEDAIALAEIVEGTPLTPMDTRAQVVLSLELPYIDRMPLAKVQRFLADHEDDVYSFRRALQKLIKPESASDPVESAVAEIRDAVADLMRSEKFARMRARILRIGGMIATFSAGISGMERSVPGSPWVGAIASAAPTAAAALGALWLQHVASREARSKNPFHLLWQLGMDAPPKVRAKRKVTIRAAPPGATIDLRCHWLCPPTHGMRWLFIKE